MATDPTGALKELATSRARFVAELGERLAAIRHGLARLGAAPGDASGELNAVRRRLHALAAAAEVLHFTAAADAIARAEAELAGAGSAPSIAPVRERVTRILDLLPSLALGAPIQLDPLASEPLRAPREPLCVLVFGDESLLAALSRPGPLRGAEAHRTSEPEALLALVARLGPDVLLLDGDNPAVADVVARLRQSSEPLPLVVAGDFDAYEALSRLVRRGVARVLPKPLDAAALQRTLLELVPREVPHPAPVNPFAAAGGVSLADAIASEARRAFDAPRSSGEGPPAGPLVALGADSANRALAALWSAFARLRLLAERDAEGRLLLPVEGPFGCVPLAPALVDEHAAPARTSAEALAGRRLVVADADPTLLGALTRALQRLGASVLPARDAAQAIELCERHWPDALIADSSLEPGGGFELCRRLRQDLALADLPVGLVCWREDLLQHARRLSEQRGAEPHPLDPEAFAPLGAALAPRMALERRLEQREGARGRLDGLTPRSLLQLCSRRGESVALFLRAGRLSAEVALVDGRPIHARLSEATGVVAEGPAALAPLLGMRVGRFSVEPLATAPAAHFSGDLMTVLAPPIARSRRARAWLEGAGPEDLERVEVEPRVCAAYLEEAPAPHRVLLARLLRGESARALAALEGAASAGGSPLMAALVELARRGGLVALVDRSGRDVLEHEAGRSASPRPARARGEAPVLPAALTLAEAVLQAVSGEAEKSPRRRTQRGLAPPSAEPVAAPVTSGGAGVASGPVSSEPRELAGAWSSEPDPDEEPTGDHERPDDELEGEVVGGAPRSGLRSVAAPALVAAAAAGLAFATLRLLTGGDVGGLGAGPLARLESLLPGTARSTLEADPGPIPTPGPGPSAPPAAPSPVAAPVPAATTPSPVAAPPEAPDPGTVATAGTPAAPAPGSDRPRSLADAGSDAGVPPLTDRPMPVADVELATELLDAPPELEPAVPAGQGLLELRSWAPLPLYVDGQWVATAATRLLPLPPGPHRVRLGDSAQPLERWVTVEASQLTRLTARPKRGR